MFQNIQHPQNELSWEDRPTKLAKIKVGDKLWIGEGSYPCSRGIKEVTRVTDTLIIIEKGKERWERFRKTDGYQIGRMVFSNYIGGVATEAEVKAYDAEQLRKTAEEIRKLKEQQAIDNTRNELDALFNNEAIYVRQEYHPVGFSVTFSGLTEEQVRELAIKLK